MSDDKLREALRWCVENDGECLGDYPRRLAAFRAALAEPLSASEPPDELSDSDMREAFGNLSDYALSNLAAATPEQIEEIERAMHAIVMPQFPPLPASDPGDALALAIRFHETYERLAPSFGYETRPDTKVFDPESKNGRLMVAVCAALATPTQSASTAERDIHSCSYYCHRPQCIKAQRDELRERFVALAALPLAPVLTDEQIVEIRDEPLPSRGDSLDCIAFARVSGLG